MGCLSGWHLILVRPHHGVSRNVDFGMNLQAAYIVQRVCTLLCLAQDSLYDLCSLPSCFACLGKTLYVLQHR